MAEAAGGGWAKWRIWLIAAGAGLISLLLYDAFRVLLAEVHASEVMRQMAAEPPGVGRRSPSGSASTPAPSWPA